MNTISVLATHPVARPESSTIKAAADGASGSGNYGVIGLTLQIAGEVFLKPCERALAAGAGNGNATGAAAHRFTEVSTALVLTLLASAKLRMDTDCRIVASRFHHTAVFVSVDARSISR
jgi:hypothetical protein